MKNRIRKILLAAACMAVCAGLGACGAQDADTKENDGSEGAADPALAGLDQTGGPESGDQIAVIEVEGMGTIRIRLFAQAAPKAVENFVTHAEEGYYDGVTFHRVIDDFMIQGGDPTGTGGGGESIWGEDFENECNDVLMPIRGALCMANAGADTNGSQLFIVQTKNPNLSGGEDLTAAQKKLFEENGGTPWLVGGYTVFGQVIEGMDVVDAVAAVETDASDKPVEDVVMSSVTIETAD